MHYRRGRRVRHCGRLALTSETVRSDDFGLCGVLVGCGSVSAKLTHRIGKQEAGHGIFQVTGPRRYGGDMSQPDYHWQCSSSSAITSGAAQIADFARLLTIRSRMPTARRTSILALSLLTMISGL